MIKKAVAEFENLPAELATRHADLLAALSHGDDPRNEWTGNAYEKAHAPKAIAQILIPVLHPGLKGRLIAYLWREELQGKPGRLTLGKAKLATGLIKHFSKMDFVIEFNWTEWQNITERQKVALVDHELMHCALDLESGKSIIVPHDVEEFGAIVDRWGLWKRDLEQFGESVKKATQLSFEMAGAE